MTARYTSKARPTKDNLIGGTYAETHLTKPKPMRKDSGEGPKAENLTENVEYIWSIPHGAFTYEETGDFFDVTEVWETFLESNN